MPVVNTRELEEREAQVVLSSMRQTLEPPAKIVSNEARPSHRSVRRLFSKGSLKPCQRLQRIAPFPAHTGVVE